MEIIAGPEWKELGHALIQSRGITIIIGDTDSGKSTLAYYLVRELLTHNRAIALIDADIGQSSLGVPCTISMKSFRTISDLKTFAPDSIIFIGTLNPANKIPHIISATQRMTALAISKGADNIIVDTTGLISGDVGREIKIGKIRAVKPGHIIAVQMQAELEHILAHVKDTHIHRLRPSRFAKRRSRESRVQYRQMKMQEYFRNADSIALDLKGLQFIYNDRPFNIHVDRVHEGTFVGLNHNEDTLALGIVEEQDNRSITVRSPTEHLEEINRIIVGDIILNVEDY